MSIVGTLDHSSRRAGHRTDTGGCCAACIGVRPVPQADHNLAPASAGPQHVRMRQQVVKGNSVKYMPGAGPAVPQRCPETGSGFLMGGPYWAEPIHDPTWLQGVLKAVQARAHRCACRCRATLVICSTRFMAFTLTTSRF